MRTYFGDKPVKYKTKILVRFPDGRTETVGAEGDHTIRCVRSHNVDPVQARSACVGDWIKMDCGIYPIVGVTTQEYDPAETNPDHAIRDSLPTNEIAG